MNATEIEIEQPTLDDAGNVTCRWSRGTVRRLLGDHTDDRLRQLKAEVLADDPRKEPALRNVDPRRSHYLALLIARRLAARATAPLLAGAA